MTTETTTTESTISKRPRRSKPQDPQFVFDNPTVANESTANPTPTTPKRAPKKTTQSVDSTDTSGDLYEPGDIVWCKLGGFPWWPALIYRCSSEGGIHTKTLNSNNKPKRLFFVYFYGKYLEYSWISTRWLLKYAGLSNFIQHAENAVQQAATKSEQQELANRYQLKVSIKKRVQWDEAIELADRALTMTKEERIEEFSELLQDAAGQSKSSRRRKSTVEDGEENEIVPETTTAAVATNSEGNSIRKPLAFSENGEDEQVSKKRRSRKRKNDSETDVSNSLSETPTQRKRSTSFKEQTSNKRKTPKSNISNGQVHSSMDIKLIQATTPPLSNYEQKQILDGLLHHPKDKELTFDEAQTFAIDKAIEIIFENHNYRMTNISSEWFYELLLKSPAIVSKYRSWFENISTDNIPNGNDMIELKQWQIALMLQAQIKAEQQQQSNDN